MSWGSIIGGITSSVSSNPIGWVSAGLAGYDYFTRSDQADDAADAANRASEAQIANAERTQGIYDEGSTALAETLTALMGEYGNFGAITPNNFQGFTDYVRSSRISEEAEAESEIERLLNEITAGTTALDEKYRSEMFGLEADGRSLAGEYHNGARKQTDADTLALFMNDTLAGANAPRWQDHAMEQDLISTKFARLFDEQTDNELATAYGEMAAALPPGMENSTMAVEMRKGLAGKAAEIRNQNLLRSIEAAQGYISGLQGTAAAGQQMAMDEREMARVLFSDALGARSTNSQLASGAFGDEVTGGEYGIRVSGAGRDIRDGNLNYLSKLRTDPYNEYIKKLGIPSRRAVEDYDLASGMLDNTYNLRAKGFNEASSLATAPFDYRAKGATASSGAYASAANTTAKTRDFYTDLARQSAAGLGSQLQRTFNF